MIAGVGIDIVEVARIEKLLTRFGDAFLTRTFTPAELAEGVRRKHAPTYYAGRWAVKEATAKALGCGIGGNCALTDVETCPDPASGAPILKLGGAAAEYLRTRGGGRFSLSVSHESSYATAVVILEQ